VSHRLPIAIIGGFLGAGKTTLINRLLSSGGAARTAVLVNDFGAVNIDRRLIAGSDVQVLTLSNGCLCCALRNDLVGQVEELIRQRGADINRMVIETSGVADPAQVVHTLGYPQLRNNVGVSGVATVIDATRFAGLSGAARELAEAQVLAADVAVITKTDLAPPHAAEPLRTWCRTLGIRILGPEDVSGLLVALFGDDVPAEVVTRPSALPAAESTFESWHFEELRPMSLLLLRAALASLPQEIYRAKGFVSLAEVPDSECVVQVVGERVEFARMAAGREGNARGVLAFIGLRGRVDWHAVETRLRACVANGVG
jgi:G3E family GTPase